MNHVINLSRDRYLNVLLFSDDLFVIENKKISFANIYLNLSYLQAIHTNFHYKYKGNGISRQGTSKNKNVIYLIINQVSNFKYLRNDIGYDKNRCV